MNIGTLVRLKDSVLEVDKISWMGTPRHQKIGVVVGFDELYDCRRGRWLVHFIEYGRQWWMEESLEVISD